jgi:hypothetical protein
MKAPLLGRGLAILLGLVTVIIGAALLTTDCPAVTSLTVSPETYTLDHRATRVTVQADTRAPGSRLVFDIYIDADGDGTLDPGDARFMSFSVADGQVPHLGNTSFWHDEDGATNSFVKATLAANGEWRFSGDLILKAIDEDSSTATASFRALQDASYPCLVTGQVQLDGSPAAWAIVFIEHEADPSGASRDFSDANGMFHLRVKYPGTYTVLAYGAGISKFDQGSAQPVKVLEGTNDLQQPLVLFPGNRAISGKVFASDTGEGLRGIVVLGGSCAVVTDDDGNYTLVAEDGEWEVRAELGHMYGLGYVPQEPLSVTVSGSDMPGIDLLCHRATTLIKGTIRDANTQEALQGYEVMLWGPGDGMRSGGYSGADGSYAAGVVAGDWTVESSGHILFYTDYVEPPSQHVHAPAQGAVPGIDFALDRFAVQSVRRSGQWLELCWTAERGAVYRIEWSPDLFAWCEVPDPVIDGLWIDDGTAPGMNGSPGDPNVRERLYTVKREWE